MMVHIAPQIYRKYITVDRQGTPLLYMKLQNALYGLMRVSLLFYRKLHKELEEYGLMVNPYDPCVATKYVGDGEQLTVVWHVDDLMGLCTNDFKLTKLSCYLADIYGPKLTMHTGANQEYLGIDFEFKNKRRPSGVHGSVSQGHDNGVPGTDSGKSSNAGRRQTV
jgi:hypothetical protein